MMLLSLGLLLMALMAASTQSTGFIEKFGCKFINNEYALSNEVVHVVRYENTTIYPIQLYTEDQLETLVQQIKFHYGEVKKEVNFNTIDDYMALAEAYERANGSLNFRLFFGNYKPRYQSGVNSVELIIHTLNRIRIKMFPNYTTIAQHIFMAAAQECLTLDTSDVTNLKETFLGTEKGQRITNIFGVVKFMLGTRLGHILFDSGIEIPDDPLVIMHDGLPPSTENKDIYKRERHTIPYSIVESNPFFIMAKIGSIGQYRSILEMLIYLGYPYCSPIDITKKYELLKFDRYLVRRFADGEPHAGIFFHNLYNLDSKYRLIIKTSSFDHFHAFYVDEYSRRKAEFPIPYSQFNVAMDAPVILTSKESFILDKIASKLQMSTSDFYAKLKRVSRLMRNGDFLKDINLFAMKHKKQSIEIYIKPQNMRKSKKRKN